MKRCWLATAVFGCVLAAEAVVNPFGDAIFWWRGGRDGANGCAKDGYFTQGELVDTRHAKDTTFWNQGFSTLTKQGAANNTLLPYLDETVTAPYARQDYAASTIYFPQTFTVTTNYNANGEATTIDWMPQQISRLYLPMGLYRDSCVNGVCSNWTAFIRFRRDGVEGKYSTSSCDTPLLINYNWGTMQGIELSFLGTDATQASAKAKLSIGQFQPSDIRDGRLTITRGQWMDFAVSVTGRVVTVCWCIQDGMFSSLTYDVSSRTNVKDLSLTASSLIHVGTDNNITYSKSVFNVAQNKFTTEGNALMAFRGAVAQLAFWDRALDVREMQEVFGYPRPAALTAGVKDGGTDEYRGTATTAAAGTGAWDDLDPALAAGESRTVKFTLPVGKEKPQYLLRVFPASGTASGRLAATLNGQPVATASFSGARTWMAFVKSGFLKSGENTLTLTRTDAGTGTLLIDALEMSGAYIVGRDSNDSTILSGETDTKANADKANVLFDYDVLYGAETNLVKGVNVRKDFDCTFSITFPLDAETLKAAKGMSYLTRLVNRDNNTTVDFPAARFAVNGHVFHQYAAGEFPTTYGYIGPFDIPKECLKEGTNTFVFSADYIGGNTSKWRSFSFHQFELQPADQGTLFLLR